MRESCRRFRGGVNREDKGEVGSRRAAVGFEDLGVELFGMGLAFDGAGVLEEGFEHCLDGGGAHFMGFTGFWRFGFFWKLGL